MNHNLYFHNPSAVHLHDHKRDTISDRNLDLLARVLWKVTEPIDNETTNCLVGLVSRELKSYPIVNILNPHLGIDYINTRCKFLHFGLLFVELIHDVANEFF